MGKAEIDYYRTKALEYPQLEQVILGEMSLTSTLETVVTSAKNPGEDFKHYLLMLEDLASTSLKKEDVPFYSDGQAAKNVWAGGVTGVGMYTAGTFALTAIFPPLAPVGLVILAVFGLAGSSMGGGFAVGLWGRKRTLKKIADKRRKMLEPLYDLTRTLDEDISRTFLYDHFTNNPERFEQTFHSMASDEKMQVREELYRLQEGGGMEMDQPALKKYLNSL